MSSFKLDKISVFMNWLELIADFWLNLIDWAYQISVNEIHEIHFHMLYTNTKEIYTSEIWECKQKIFSENAAWDWITACKNRLDWNLKQEDKHDEKQSKWKISQEKHDTKQNNHLW